MTALAPDGPTPIEAWRTWTIWELPYSRATRIGSMPRPGYVWPCRHAERAVCRRVDGCCDAPRWGCSCGYYGLTSAAFVDEMSRAERVPYAVVGKVQLWGRVIVGERGWRAQFAYPAALYLPSDAGWEAGRQQTLMQGVSAYGVPVSLKTMAEIVDEAREWVR